MKEENTHSTGRFKAWAILLTCLAGIYFIGVSLGPWLQHHIHGMDEIVAVMEENDIDGGAYYYTEIEGAAAGCAYLDQSLRYLAPEHHGITLPFLSGVAACLLILFFGFRLLPR